MKLIVAIIRPEKLEPVQAALKMWEVCLISISQVLSEGGEPGCKGMYRGTEFQVRPSKLRLEIAVKDQLVETAVEAIVRSACTANSAQTGEIKVIVIPLDGCVLSGSTDEDSQLLNDVREAPFARRGRNSNVPPW